MQGTRCVTGPPGWALLLAFSSVPLVGEAACYQLFDTKDRLVLQSTRSPVDLSKSISEEVARLYPGHSFIMAADGPCPEVDKVNRSEVKLPERVNRGPIQLSGELSAQSTGEQRGQPAAEPRGTAAAPPRTAAPRPLPTCYTGPEGGTFTYTKSGKRNYSGC